MGSLVILLSSGALYSQKLEDEVIDFSRATAIGAIDKKLDGIVIPNLEFAETAFKDCVAYLWAISIELDHDEINPNKKGLRIVLDAPESDEIPITIRLADIPLRQALRYIAALGQAEMRVEQGGVVLVPLAGPTDMLTEVYQFSSNFVKNQGKGKSARVILEEAGITFSAGTAAVFNSESYQLIIRNHESQHAKVRAFLIDAEAERD